MGSSHSSSGVFVTSARAIAQGRIVCVCVGDVVHNREQRAYAVAVGQDPFDSEARDNLRRAVKAQIRELYRSKDIVEAAEGHVQVMLGNHDEPAIKRNLELGTRGGLMRYGFDQARGGVALPDDLASWISSFPREVVYHGVHFAHAGPTLAMQHFDDFFDHDPDTKTWWYEKKGLVQQAGPRFSVYGHTVMKQGVYIDKEPGFAMIDALAHTSSFWR